MKISELFESIQGEGKHVGMPAFFIRFGKCNLLCDHEWTCDTIEIWKKYKEMSVQDIADHFEDFTDKLASSHHIVITGGEPLMHESDLIHLIESLTLMLGFHPFIEIETNGTLTPSSKLCALVDQWNVSPKLANSGMREQVRVKSEAIEKFRRQPDVIFKFVISNQNDFIEMRRDFVFRFNLRHETIFLMPSGASRSELNKSAAEVVKIALASGYRMTPRMHIDIFDTKKGV